MSAFVLYKVLRRQPQRQKAEYRFPGPWGEGMGRGLSFNGYRVWEKKKVVRVVELNADELDT